MLRKCHGGLYKAPTKEERRKRAAKRIERRPGRLCQDEYIAYSIDMVQESKVLQPVSSEGGALANRIGDNRRQWSWQK